MPLTIKQRELAAVVPAMVLPFIAALFYFVIFSATGIAQALYAFTKLFTVIWPIVAMRYLFAWRPSALNLKSREHRAAIPGGLIIGVLVAVLMSTLMQTGFGDVVRTSAPAIRAKADELGVTAHYWIFAIFLSVVHSLIEEYYWRWFVYGRLAQMTSSFRAHLLAGAAFASHHIVIATQFFPFWFGVLLGCCVGVGGMIWSVLYQRQRTLAGAWVCHLIVDLQIMWIGAGLIFG